jgi:hypothetical protein
LTPAPAVRASALQSTDDLLDSLDLGAPSESSAELDFATDLDEDKEEAVEELEVLPDDAPEPVSPPPPRPGRTTLVKGPEESEDLRRRIGPPVQAAPENVLDELSVDDDTEEISLEDADVGKGHSVTGEKPDVGKGHSFTGLRDDAQKAARPPAPASPPAPAPAPAAQADARPHIVPAPLSIPVEITASRSEHDLTVPIEVTVGRAGTATLRLHIELKIKFTE